MARVYQLRRNDKVLNVFSIFIQLWEEHTRKQNDLRKRKLNVVYYKAYEYFYELEIIKEMTKKNGSVDVFPTFKAQQEAKTKACQLCLELENLNRIDYFYKLIQKKGMRRCLKQVK